jgi:lipid II:glycine glycyltransferase (peptidoglycan interpeptide bridge formation enzyme)
VTQAVTVEEVTSRQQWDDLILSAGGHPLQLWGWGEAKSTGSWTARRLRIVDGETNIGLVQVLVRALPWPFKALSYVPRGPVICDAAGATGYGVGHAGRRALVVATVVDWCRRNVGGVGVTFEPDWLEGTRVEVPKMRPARNTILIPSTLIFDLSQSEETLQSAMTKKTRQYIRKSQREDLEFREVKSKHELAQCLDIYRATAQRAGFGIHEDSYYELVKSELGDNAPIFAAFARSVEGGRHDRAVAFVWLAASSVTSFELYGGMNDDGQRMRANYALKWFAMQQMAERGIRRYDVNGLLNDGVSTFKRGFASHEDMLIGTIDVPLNGFLYGLWERVLPAGQRFMRRLPGRR